MVEIVSAKLINHILVDFTSEAEMELYISKFEKMGEKFYKSLKKVGLLDGDLMEFGINKVDIQYLNYLSIKMKSHTQKDKGY